MKEFPIRKEINRNTFTKTKCALCGKPIEDGEVMVAMPTGTYYAIWKNIAFYHLGCFLRELQKIFKEEIELTETGKKLAVVYSL